MIDTAEVVQVAGHSSSNDGHDITTDILQKVPERLIEYCAKNLSPLPTDINLMNGHIAHYMIQVLKDTSRSRAYSIASMLVNKYPQLGDRVRGQTFGKGYESLGMRIYNATNYRKDINDKKRKGAPDALFNVEEEEERSIVSRRQDQYGCVEYLAGPRPDDYGTLEEKRLWLFNIYNDPTKWNLEEIIAVLNATYYSQRQMINAENRCILQFILYWPFFGESKFLLKHASRVIYGKEGRLGEDIYSIWHKNLKSTAPAFKQHCKDLCLTAKSKEKKTKNAPDFQYMEVVIVQAEEMCKDFQNEIPNAIVMFQLLVAYFKEEEDLLLKLIDVSFYYSLNILSYNF